MVSNLILSAIEVAEATAQAKDLEVISKEHYGKGATASFAKRIVLAKIQASLLLSALKGSSDRTKKRAIIKHVGELNDVFVAISKTVVTKDNIYQVRRAVSPYLKQWDTFLKNDKLRPEIRATLKEVLLRAEIEMSKKAA